MKNILSVNCRFHAISCKNALSWIPLVGVQGLTVLYPILCYNGPLYNGAWLHMYNIMYVNTNCFVLWELWLSLHEAGSFRILSEYNSKGVPMAKWYQQFWWLVALKRSEWIVMYAFNVTKLRKITFNVTKLTKQQQQQCFIRHYTIKDSSKYL